MDNVLFVGNGYDLNNGMKTKYTDFLKSLNISESVVSHTEKLITINKYMLMLNNIQIISPNIESRTMSGIHIRNTKFGGTSSLNNISKDVQKWYTKNNIGLKDIVKFYELSYDKKLKILVILAHRAFEKTRPSDDVISVRIDSRLYAMLKGDKNATFLTVLDVDKFLGINKNIVEKYSVFAVYLETILKNNFIEMKRIKELQPGDNWIDVENILFENQFSCFKSIIQEIGTINEKIYRYDGFVEMYEIKSLEHDFCRFKLQFCEYISKQQANIDTNKVKINFKNIAKMFNISKVYNFNYSNYINKIIEENSLDIFYDNIHGNVEHGEYIVFGTNHYLFDKELIKYNKNLVKIKKDDYQVSEEANYKLTKIYQVLKLSTKRKTKSVDTVQSLTILGHSIGKQDFEYMHTIIKTNPEKIILNIVWCSWYNEKDEHCDNQEELTEAVYEMLSKYEEIYGDITVHRMILENRIKFINFDTI